MMNRYLNYVVKTLPLNAKVVDPKQEINIWLNMKNRATRRKVRRK